VSVAENATAVTTVTATDPDAGQTKSYAIVGGADQALFAISASGALTFKSAPNFEAPADSDHNNSYVVQVAVSDNGSPVLSDTQTITVNVTDVNDNAPVITTAAAFSIAENTTAVGALTSTDADTVGTKPAVFSITGGADAAKFAISAGNLVFASAPDYENPSDTDHNNSYIVQVSASDGTNVTNKLVTVSVTDVAEGTTNHAPVITSNGGGASGAISLAENLTAVTTVTATDSDAGQTLSYVISGGADAAKFAVNGTTGALSFITAPDFEAPADSGANNVYDVIVGARDNLGALDTQALAVTITNANGLTVNGTASADTLNGTPEADTINGNDGNDVLNGLAGNDTLFGGNGADVLDGGPGADALHGGPGIDVFIWDPADTAIDAGNARDILRLTGSGTTIDLSQAIANSHIDGIGVVDLTGSGNNTANLSINDVFAMCWDNYLRFDGNAGDRVTVLDTANWARAADQVVGSNTYHVWSGSGATLLIDTDVTTNLV
jgi:Ca2+-binding RTX toxin-like protein